MHVAGSVFFIKIKPNFPMVAEASSFCILWLKWKKKEKEKKKLKLDCICTGAFEKKCFVRLLDWHDSILSWTQGCPASLASRNESWPLPFLSELLQMLCYVKQCKEWQTFCVLLLKFTFLFAFNFNLFFPVCAQGTKMGKLIMRFRGCLGKRLVVLPRNPAEHCSDFMCVGVG